MGSWTFTAREEPNHGGNTLGWDGMNCGGHVVVSKMPVLDCCLPSQNALVPLGLLNKE